MDRALFPTGDRCKAFSVLTLKTVDAAPSAKRRLIGTATTPKPDRMEDVVAPDGAQFSLPLSFLAHHDSREPIGNVVSAKVSADGITIECEIPSEDEVAAQNGALDYIERAWSQIKLKLVRGLSIGFRPLEWEPIKGTNGFLFKKWEWLELSSVTIPAQSEATIDTIKALAHGRVPAASGTNATAPRLSLPSAASGAIRKNLQVSTAMNLSPRIEAKQNEIAALRDQHATLEASFADRDPSEDESAQVLALCDRIDAEERTLATFKRSEQSRAHQTTAVVPASGQRSASIHTMRPRTIQRAQKADLIMKAGICVLRGHARKANPFDIAKTDFAGDEELALIVKAAVNPADTVTPGWAKELVGEQVGELVDVLAPISVYGALASRALRVNFSGAGLIRVPSRSKTPNLAGVFVGEGKPIPVKQGHIDSVNLYPHKAAVISTFTRELAMATSNPSIEKVIRDGILDDTSIYIDTALLDAAAADSIRPAGLLNGVVTIPSSGNASDDMQALLTAIVAAGGGRSVVVIMNPIRAISLAFTTNATGAFIYRDELAQDRFFGASVIRSTNVPPGTIIVMDAADFATATGDSPEWDVSDVATIHEEDTTPLPIVDAAGVAAKPIRSLWQTASIGIRMIWPLTWAMRRTGMVAAMTDAAW